MEAAAANAAEMTASLMVLSKSSLPRLFRILRLREGSQGRMT
jgi:hypothetical protein